MAGGRDGFRRGGARAARGRQAALSSASAAAAAAYAAAAAAAAAEHPALRSKAKRPRRAQQCAVAQPREQRQPATKSRSHQFPRVEEELVPGPVFTWVRTRSRFGYARGRREVPGVGPLWPGEGRRAPGPAAHWRCADVLQHGTPPFGARSSTRTRQEHSAAPRCTRHLLCWLARALIGGRRLAGASYLTLPARDRSGRT